MLTRKKVTLRASKITTLRVPRSLVENPPNFTAEDKRKTFKIPFWLWFPSVILLIFLFSTIFAPQKSDIPDYMTTTNTYKPITPQEPVKVETTNLFVCGNTTSVTEGFCYTLNMFTSSWFGIILFIPIIVILYNMYGTIRRMLR